ncbi:hypothetical protein BBJ29_006522 [Phytophthora kernoviae]|uniref:RxLR effector protein n=1 Tax=Phytophthora kernoviae TaxID=325452 RepID=A0A3F2S310_9STRA|nr:hypothetical protein BBP00_00000975 [Phytophthora kernoviae]RLN68826.1 hypothetical protein BBJ29_006522 [Phytophthora kernoviae]
MNIGKIFAYIGVVSLAVGSLVDAAGNSHRQLGAGGGIPASTVSPPTQQYPQQPPTTQVGSVFVGQDSQQSSGSNHGNQPSTELPYTDIPVQQSSGSNHGNQPSTELPYTDIPVQQSSGSSYGSQSWSSSSGSQAVGDAYVGQEDPNDDLTSQGSQTTTQSVIQSRALRH